MCLKPAPPDFGIRFRRLDLAERPMIAARHEEVVQTARATTLGKNGTAIHTVEHLMAAFMGRGVDNALVELDGPEVPIFDGSAAPYLALLDEAQLKEQKLPRKYIKVTRSFTIEQGGSFMKVHPATNSRSYIH
jgi:UDP-3-O-acyl-N-acetylglucosamine deacetylase